MGKITVTGQLTLTGGQLNISPPPPPPTGPQLFTWGESGFGQLANNEANVYPSNYSSPIQVSALTDWASVEAGDNHSHAIKTDGTLWSWGKATYGVLGHGIATTSGNRSSPVQIGALTDWASVDSGLRQSMAIKTDGTMWAWGNNSNGQLGTSNTTSYSSPVQIGALTTWATISSGQTHALAVKTDGTLWAWGYGGNGQLGQGATSNTNSPIQIGALTTWSSVGSGSGGNRQHSVAVKTDGTLWTWGRNNTGQLGQGNTTDLSSPVQVGALATWDSVVSGAEFTLARKTDGTIWAWGLGSSGQLGVATNQNRSSPVQIGALTDWASINSNFSTSFAIKTNGTLFAWGDGSTGHRGDGKGGTISSPVQIGALTDWSKVSGGDNHSLAIKTDGTLEAWGQISFGQLGNGQANAYSANRSSPIQVGALLDWAALDAGDDHAIAIKTDGTLWSWGKATYGVLGHGIATTSGNRSSPVQVGALTDWSSINSGYRHNMAIKTDGTLWAWGINSFSSLGTGNSTSYSSPVQIGGLTDWSQVAAGNKHTLAIKTDGSLWAWGYAGNGQLGNEATSIVNSPIQIGSLTDWASVAAGKSSSASTRNHSLAIKTDGTLWAWGDNSPHGKLGLGDVNDRSSPVQVGNLADWANVSAGNEISHALKTDGTLWAIGGFGNAGRLGLGDSISRSSPVQIGSLTDWTSIANKFITSFAIKTDGTLWAWGPGGSGKRGDGSTISVSSPIQIGSETNWTSISGGGNHTIAIKTTT